MSEPDRRRLYVGGALVALVAGVLLWAIFRGDPQPPSGAPTSSSGATNAPPLGPTGKDPVDAMAAWQAMGGGDGGPNAPAPTGLVIDRVKHAQDQLDHYLLWARYPPESRPLSDHPDLATPDTASERKQLFVKKDGSKRGDVVVRLSQSTAFVVGDESIRFEVTCEGQGKTFPCAISSAEATAVPPPPNTPTIPVRFADDGQNTDVKAGDDTFTSVFTPSATSLAGKDNRIGIAVWLKYQGDDGQAFFQFDYTAAEPARFTGRVTESMVNGSLALDLEMDVKKAGRYVLTARVEDAAGKGFALLEHNASLASGTTNAHMLVFGKLVKDNHAIAPFKVRDLSGFLLKEDVSPDRENLKDTKGVFHTTKAYADGDFSDAEWQSDEKKRTVDEFEKDVKLAKESPSAAGPPSVLTPGGMVAAPK